MYFCAVGDAILASPKVNGPLLLDGEEKSYIIYCIYIYTAIDIKIYKLQGGRVRRNTII